MKKKKLYFRNLTMRAVVSPGRTLRYEGRETTASSRLLFQVKGAVSRNSAKLGNHKMPVKLRET